MHSSIFLSVHGVIARCGLNLSRMLVCKRVPNVSWCQFNEGTRHLQQRTLRNGVTLSSDSSPYVAQFVMACNIHARQNYHTVCSFYRCLSLSSPHITRHFLLRLCLSVSCSLSSWTVSHFVTSSINYKIYL